MLLYKKIGGDLLVSYINGIVSEIQENSITIECNGIGYFLFTSGKTSSELSKGEVCKIHTYLLVRQDDISLFGFKSIEEREMFTNLIKINGVGPKAALNILSTLTLGDIYFAVLNDNTSAFLSVSGIGKKTASRILMELDSKLSFDKYLEAPNEIDKKNESTSSSIKDAIEALIALGYSNTEAYLAVNSVKNIEDLDSGRLLKEALKNVKR